MLNKPESVTLVIFIENLQHTSHFQAYMCPNGIWSIGWGQKKPKQCCSAKVVFKSLPSTCYALFKHVSAYTGFAQHHIAQSSVHFEDCFRFASRGFMLAVFITDQTRRKNPPI